MSQLISFPSTQSSKWEPNFALSHLSPSPPMRLLLSISMPILYYKLPSFTIALVSLLLDSLFFMLFLPIYPELLESSFWGLKLDMSLPCMENLANFLLSQNQVQALYVAIKTLKNLLSLPTLPHLVSCPCYCVYTLCSPCAPRGNNVLPWLCSSCSPSLEYPLPSFTCWKSSIHWLIGLGLHSQNSSLSSHMNPDR